MATPLGKNGYTMMKTTTLYRVTLFGLLILATSCSSIVRKEEPSLSHVHIGHAITGWESAPNKQGLLVAAELFAIEAKANSDLMLEVAKQGNTNDVKEYMSNIMKIVDPTMADPDLPAAYGLRRSLAEALLHLKVASEIFDASQNVRRTMANSYVKGQGIVNNIDELSVFLETAQQSTDSDELILFAEEISRLMNMITGDLTKSEGYGVQRLRQDVDAMVAREDPPYQTIDKFYLFSIGI